MKRGLAAIALGVPLAVFGYLLATPRANATLTSPVEHLVINWVTRREGQSAAHPRLHARVVSRPPRASR